MNLRAARTALAVLLGLIMIVIGTEHLVNPDPFIAIVPSLMPAKRLLVVVSGLFEIAGGAGIIIPRTRPAAAIGLILLYICVFPANINMAVNDVPISGHHFSSWVLWLRLPFQGLLIVWAYWCGGVQVRGEKEKPSDQPN